MHTIIFEHPELHRYGFFSRLGGRLATRVKNIGLPVEITTGASQIRSGLTPIGQGLRSIGKGTGRVTGEFIRKHPIAITGAGIGGAYYLGRRRRTSYAEKSNWKQIAATSGGGATGLVGGELLRRASKRTGKGLILQAGNYRGQGINKVYKPGFGLPIVLALGGATLGAALSGGLKRKKET